MHSLFPSARPAVLLSSLIATASLLTACTIGGVENSSPADSHSEADAQASAAADASASAAAKAKQLQFSVKDGASDVDPSEPVEVTSPAGLKSVTMTNEAGKVVEDELSSDSTTWKSAEVLGYNRTYTIDATDKDLSLIHI